MRPGKLASETSQEISRWFPDNLPGTTLQGSSKGSGHSESRLSRARILVADDNAGHAGLRGTPAPEGHGRVLRASNGRAGTGDCSKGNPLTWSLADVMMPEMDGFELLKALRANRKTPARHRSSCSPHEPERSPEIEGLQAGADDYLIKPFSARELIARVGTQLALRQRSSQFETLVRQAPIGIVVLGMLSSESNRSIRSHCQCLEIFPI